MQPSNLIRCSPHTLRHTAAVKFLRNGGDVFSLQRMLGHASLEMTRRYCELADTDVKQAHIREAGDDPAFLLLVYIDPPYFSKDRSPVECDYSRMYHFLEGIANYDIWNDLINYRSLNLHFKENGYRWPEKTKVVDKFEQLFSMLSKSIIILSYKSPGIPKEEELASIMRKYKKSVQVHRLPYRYALRKAEEELSQNFELLIIGR